MNKNLSQALLLEGDKQKKPTLLKLMRMYLLQKGTSGV